MKAFTTLLAVIIWIYTDAQNIPHYRYSDFPTYPAIYLDTDSSVSIADTFYRDPSTPVLKTTANVYSSISSGNGDLIIYSNGRIIYDKNHEVVPFGDSLSTGERGVYKSIIVPAPYDSNKLYVFNTAIPGNRGLYYSLYDCKANSIVPGKQNVKVLDSLSNGAVTAVRASNNIDWWIIFFSRPNGNSNDQAICLKLSVEGISSEAKISKFPTWATFAMSNQNFQFSTCGKLFAVSADFISGSYMHRFDNHIGLFSSDTVSLGLTTQGISFSPYGCNILANTTESDSVRVWGLSDDALPEINFDSLLFHDPNANNQTGNTGNMVLGFNNFIHQFYNFQIHRFGNTDALPSQIQLDSVDLSTMKLDPLFYGRQLYNPNVFHKLQPTVRNFTYHGQCLPDTTHFTYIDNNTYCVQYDSLRWRFGDPSSGNRNTSTITHPSHLYSDTGEYFVQLFKYNGSDIDTITNWVTISKYPELEVPSDTVICTASDVVLRLNINDESYHHWLTYGWDGKSSRFIRVTKSDTLIARAMNQLTCETKDTVIVQFSDLPKPSSEDFHICLDDTLKINLKQGASYASWGSDSSDIAFSTTDPGNYRVRWEDSLGCSATDTFKVTQSEKLEITPNHDTTICRNESVLYSIPLHTQNIRWNNGDTLRTFVGRGEGPVIVSFTDTFSCAYHDSVYLYMNDSVPMADFAFQPTCMFSNVDLKASGEVNGLNHNYQWIIGEDTFDLNEISYSFTKPGTQEIRLKVTAENGCSDTTIKQVDILPKPIANFEAPDLCHGDSVVFVNKTVVPVGYQVQYLWKLGDGNYDSTFSPKHFYELTDSTESQTFVVTLKAYIEEGCSDSLFETVTVNPLSNPYFEARIDESILYIDSQATRDGNHLYRWDLGDGSTSSAITPTHAYTNLDTNGYEICLQLINPESCVSKYCVFEKPVLGIFTPELQQVRVVPNPADHTFELVTDKDAELKSVELFDQQGRLIRIFDVEQKIYDVSELAGGVYVLRVEMEDGVMSGKLIVR